MDIGTCDDLAEFYDSVYGDMTADIELYTEYAKKQGSPMLELGCGTGRVLIPLAEAGAEVWGLDISKKMLSIAQSKVSSLGKEIASKVFLQVGDMRDFSLPKRFNLIVIPFNTFLLIQTKEDRQQALKRIRVHLNDNGLLIIHVFALTDDLLRRGLSMSIKETKSRQTDLPLKVTTFNLYDHDRRLIDVTEVFDAKQPDGANVETIHRFKMCYLSKDEMQGLLEESGFRVVETYGTFDRKPFDSTSNQMIFVAGLL